MPPRQKKQDQLDPQPTVYDPQSEPAQIAEALPPEPESLEVPPEPEKPRLPQGLTPRYLPTDHRRAFHKRWRGVRMIDPASLGEAPYLALPIGGDPTRRCIRHFPPAIAAELLSVNAETGNPPTIRLATDAEVAQYEADAKARADERAARITQKIDQVREALIR